MGKPDKGFYWQVSFTLRDKAREKIAQLRDPQLAALLIVEFLLTMALVAAILIYLDPEVDAISFPFNLVVFALIAFGTLRFYGYTGDFRANRKNAVRRNSSFRAFALEFIILLVIVSAAYVYQSPSLNTLPKPLNYILFLAVLSIPLCFYMKEKFLDASTNPARN